MLLLLLLLLLPTCFAMLCITQTEQQDSLTTLRRRCQMLSDSLSRRWSFTRQTGSCR
jgi:hypothetical protein